MDSDWLSVFFVFIDWKGFIPKVSDIVLALTCALWGPAMASVDDEPEEQHQNRPAHDQPDTDPHAGADGPGLIQTSGAQHRRRCR